MDNRIFSINGRSEDQLLAVLEVAFAQTGGRSQCIGWQEGRYGLALLWYMGAGSKAIRLPAPMSAKQVLPIVLSWLKSVAMSEIDLEHWEGNLDHDGSNVVGWRVYCNDWGKVADMDVICAVKPVYLWLGK